jgi:hypothetical protein
MSTIVRQAGFVSDATLGRQDCVFTLTNGNVMMIVADPNSGSATGGYGDASGTTKIYAYESSDRINWTLRATLTAPANFSITHFTAAVYPNNDIGLVAVLNASGSPSMVFYKLTYSGYTWSGSETIHTAITATESQAYPALSVSDASVPVVAVIRRNTTGSTRYRLLTFVRRTSDSTWVNNSTTTVLTTQNYDPTSESMHATVLQNSGSATSRRFVLALGYGTSATTDNGVRLFGGAYNETTGATFTLNILTTFAAGDVSAASISSNSTRLVRVFPTGADEVTIAAGHTEGACNGYVARYTYTGGATATTVIAPTAYSMWLQTLGAGLSFGNQAFSYGSDVLAWVTVINYTGGKSYTQVIHFDINRTTGAVSMGTNPWDNTTTPSNTHRGVMGGVNRYNVAGRFDFVWTDRLLAANSYRYRHQYVLTSRAPAAWSPASGGAVATGLVPVTADADLDKKYGQSRYKIVWQFASDSLFTTSVRTFTQADSKFANVFSTDAAGTVVRFSDTLTSPPLASGVWWVRAAHLDEYGVQGAWTTGQSFTISHAPAATNLSPKNNVLLDYGLSGAVQFGWVFTDPDTSDTQSAFQVEVSRNDDGVVVLDSTKITSSDPSWIGNIPSGEKDKVLRFRVRLYDRDDTVGAWSDYALFMVGVAPTVAISVPAAAAVVTSPIPHIEFTPTTSGGRLINSYRVLITTGGTTLYDSIVSIPGGSASGVLLTEQATENVYPINTPMTVTVTVTDSAGLVGTSAPTPFSGSWTPPATATVPGADASLYGVEGAGYVAVSWSDAARDADFTAWVVYRRDDHINPTTGAVLEVGTWKAIGYVNNPVPGGMYSYKDYYAPSNYKVNYRIEQAINRFGDIVESTNGTTVTVYPSSEGYWLVAPADSSALWLAGVTDDSYTDEYESETYTIIGRGRHVDRGDHLGLTGTLTAKIRDRDGLTARQRKQRLEAVKLANTTLYLRTPFGDVYRVSVDNIGISRISGVGKSEFIDVTIPYAEVGA